VDKTASVHVQQQPRQPAGASIPGTVAGISFHPSETRIRQMTNPGYPDKEPSERPPIANHPAPAQEFARGVATGQQAAVSREQAPGNYGRKE
jgi:hypothetical protein